MNSQSPLDISLECKSLIIRDKLGCKLSMMLEPILLE